MQSRHLTFDFPLSKKNPHNCYYNFSKVSHDLDQACIIQKTLHLSLDLWMDFFQSSELHYLKYSNTPTSYRWSHYRTLVDRISGPFRYDRSWCFRRPTPHQPSRPSHGHPPPSQGAPPHRRCPPGSSLGLGPRAVPPP